jgi:hypothetical protein
MMKKRFSAIFTVTVAAVLLSSLAFAAKKKLQAKSKPMTPDVSEVDLAAELLDTNRDHKHKAPKASDSKKHGDEELKDLIIAKQRST